MDVSQTGERMLCRTKLIEYLHMDRRLPHACIICIPEQLMIMKQELKKVYKSLRQEYILTHFIEIAQNKKQIVQRVRELIHSCRQTNKKYLPCNLIIIGVSCMAPAFVKIWNEQLKQNSGSAYIFCLHHAYFGSRIQTEDHLKKQIFRNLAKLSANSNFTRFQSNRANPTIQLTVFWDLEQQIFYYQLESCFKCIHRLQIVQISELSNPLCKLTVRSKKGQKLSKREKNLTQFLKWCQNSKDRNGQKLQNFGFAFIEALIAFGVPQYLIQQIEHRIQANKLININQLTEESVKYCIDCILTRGDSAEVFNYLIFAVLSIRNNQLKTQDSGEGSFEVKVNRRQIKQIDQLQIGKCVKTETFLLSINKLQPLSGQESGQESTMERREDVKIKFLKKNSDRKISKIQTVYVVWPLSEFQILDINQSSIILQQYEEDQSLEQPASQQVKGPIIIEDELLLQDHMKRLEITQNIKTILFRKGISFKSKSHQIFLYYTNIKKQRYQKRFHQILQQLGGVQLKSQNYDKAYLAFRLLYKLLSQVYYYNYLQRQGESHQQNYGDREFLHLSKVSISLFNCCSVLKKDAEGLNYLLDLLFYSPSFRNLRNFVPHAQKQLSNSGTFLEQTLCFLELIMSQVNGLVNVRRFQCANKYMAIIQQIFQDFWFYNRGSSNQYETKLQQFYSTLLLAQGKSLYLQWKQKKRENSKQTRQKAQKLINRYRLHIKISQKMTVFCLDLCLLEANLQEILGYNSIDLIAYCMNFSELMPNPDKFQFQRMLEILRYLKRNKNQQFALKYFNELVQNLIKRVTSFEAKLCSELDGSWLCRLKDHLLKENQFKFL